MRAQVRPQVRAVVRPQYGRGGTVDPIQALFAHGESGAVLLPGTTYGACYVERTGAAATTICGNGDPVGTYKCLVTGLYYTAPTDSARPVYVVSGALVWLDFDGIDDMLESTTSISLTALWAAAAAVKFGSVGSLSSVIDADRSAADVRHSQTIRQSAGVAQSIAFSTTRVAFTEAFGTVGTAAPHVLSVNRGAAAAEGWLAGVSNGATATTGTPEAHARNIRFGASRSGVSSSLTQFMTGRVYGALFLGREWASATERQGIETYLNAKAGA